MRTEQGRERTGESDIQRPAVMSELTTTQLTELANQFDENDRRGFDIRAEEFGWSRDEAQGVWDWFDQGHQSIQTIRSPSGD